MADMHKLSDYEKKVLNFVVEELDNSRDDFSKASFHRGDADYFHRELRGLVKSVLDKGTITDEQMDDILTILKDVTNGMNQNTHYFLNRNNTRGTEGLKNSFVHHRNARKALLTIASDEVKKPKKSHVQESWIEKILCHIKKDKKDKAEVILHVCENNHHKLNGDFIKDFNAMKNPKSKETKGLAKGKEMA